MILTVESDRDQTVGEGYMPPSDGRHTPTARRETNRPVRHFGYISKRAIGRTIANRYRLDTNPRKVRAPVDRLPGNTWARVARVTRDGKCHREQTAIFREGKGETVE
jgi:hypothetical protein